MDEEEATPGPHNAPLFHLLIKPLFPLLLILLFFILHLHLHILRFRR